MNCWAHIGFLFFLFFPCFLLDIIIFQEKLQERMWKFQVAALRRICNTLQLDRSGKTSKEELMELLLGFLSKPHAKYTKKKSAANNASKKKKVTPKKTTTSVPKKKAAAVSAKKKSAVKTKTTTTKQRASSLSLSTDDTSLPSAAELDEWVHAYVIVFDTQHVGMRHAWEILQAKFGFDNDALPFSKLKALKNQVKEQLMDAMEARANKKKKKEEVEVDDEEEQEDEKDEKEEADDADADDAMDVVETNETDAKEEEPDSTESPEEAVADEEEETGADTEKADDEDDDDANNEEWKNSPLKEPRHDNTLDDATNTRHERQYTIHTNQHIDCIYQIIILKLETLIYHLSCEGWQEKDCWFPLDYSCFHRYRRMTRKR